MGAPVLVVIPVYGHHDLTHAVLGDLARESKLADVVVVDNGGDYPAIGDERVERPGRNLGWAEGTNFGTIQARADHHEAFVWLNNDTRLSGGFVAGLLDAWRDTGAGVVAPFYNCHWLHQRLETDAPTDDYEPRRVHYRAQFTDGTCMFVPASTVESIGLLDAETFSPIGWGADIDYGLRARKAGIDIAVTRLSYLRHEKSVTGKTLYGNIEGYAERGYPVAESGLEKNWGAGWRRAAGIDERTQQTSPPSWSRRYWRRRRRVA